MSAAAAPAASKAEVLVPLPQLLDVAGYNPNSLLRTFKPKAELERSGSSNGSDENGSGSSGGDDGSGSNDAGSKAAFGCLELCRLREDALIAAGFTDIFLPIKARENASALELLPDVCAELDQHTEQRDRWDAVIRGVFAGNIFDLGCAATTSMYHEEGVSFHDTRDKLVQRPWVVDDLDALLDRLCR
ncbi:hypothetical protein COHA_000029 [Chlorella ohadii]|uniref:Damage-control phosphatase ARMT1-like metal-binding domain-containing protein n=1 Tax=Chlorella ohadii TaxID=2649997 RepID=A0AAD5E3G9_9CHLO|nr:hypothetical protein COHA_000029 [Chlorella ohadii]